MSLTNLRESEDGKETKVGKYERIISFFCFRYGGSLFAIVADRADLCLILSYSGAYRRSGSSSPLTFSAGKARQHRPGADLGPYWQINQIVRAGIREHHQQAKPG